MWMQKAWAGEPSSGLVLIESLTPPACKPIDWCKEGKRGVFIYSKAFEW
jgi:hypothetical protein